MQQIYLTEIHSDDEPDLEHDGEEVEQLQPIEVPIETLTAKQVATAKNAVPAGGGEEQAADRYQDISIKNNSLIKRWTHYK